MRRPWRFPFWVSKSVAVEAPEAPPAEPARPPEGPARPPEVIELAHDLVSFNVRERKVIGIATSDRADKQRQRIPIEVSRAAFEEFAKAVGVREMHQPRAIGRLERWWEKDGKIFVEIYISKSRDGEDALIKIQEGILRGLSIKARVRDLDWDPVEGIYIIKGMELIEISLVDVPANPDCRIVMVKSDGKPEEDGEWWDVSTFEKLDEEEKEKILARLRAVGQRVGIRRKEGEPLTPPKGYPKDLRLYADPANYSWPVDTPGRARSAIAYYNAGKGKEKYSRQEWATLGRRIARMASKIFGKRYVYKDGQITAAEAEKADAFDEVLRLINTFRGGRNMELEKRDVSSLVAALKAQLDDIAAAVEAGDAERLQELLDQARAVTEVAIDAVTRVEEDTTTSPTETGTKTSPTGTKASPTVTKSTPTGTKTSPAETAKAEAVTRADLEAFREELMGEIRKLLTGRDKPVVAKAAGEPVEMPPPAQTPAVPPAMAKLAQGRLEEAIAEAGGLIPLYEQVDVTAKEILKALGVSAGVRVLFESHS